MSQDINGQPTSEFDSSHVSKDVRQKLKDLDPKLAAGVRKVADEPPAVPRERR